MDLFCISVEKAQSCYSGCFVVEVCFLECILFLVGRAALAFP